MNEEISKKRSDSLHEYIEDAYFIGSNMDMYPMYCGYAKCRPIHSAIGNRDHYMLCFVGNGHGTFSQNGVNYHLGAGWVFMVFPNIKNEYTADKVYPWEYSWIAFDGESVIKYLKGSGFSESRPVIDLGSLYAYEKIISLTETCNSIDTMSSVRYLYACGCLYDIFAHISHIGGDEDFPTGSGLSRCVELSLRYMNARFSENISISEVAETVGLSREYFSIIFKREMGISPINYLTQLKIKRAQYLLEATDISVSEAASLSGFNDYHYFHRKFKEISNMTPAAYRELKSKEK